MKRIPLSATSGEPRAYALVDDEDYERFQGMAWCPITKGHTTYARAAIGGRITYLHRLVLGCVIGDGTTVDHKNGNGLDNRRANLRIVTAAVNAQNRRPRTFGTSRYRGVYWNKKQQKWYARARLEYAFIWLGSFDNEDEAGAVVADFWSNFDSVEQAA